MSREAGRWASLQEEIVKAADHQHYQMHKQTSKSSFRVIMNLMFFKCFLYLMQNKARKYDAKTDWAVLLTVEHWWAGSSLAALCAMQVTGAAQTCGIASW